ncbi:MAG: aminoacyl-histidine dipeptidase [Deltaproteobacteria bacterium]|nr:aminoacyl-histidine dipeptidase [Deltaproteobacteria bacterium]
MKAVLHHFEQISRIPRCSGQEEKVRDFLRQWAGNLGFAAKCDGAGNLLVTVPASPGQEAAPVIVLQCHMDMVCEKDQDSSHDFAHDPLRLCYDGEWLRAAGTTLGADNGAGLAIAMAMAEDTKLVHPPLELLFTVDEETGLNGAASLQPGFFSGRALINLDSEDEGIFTIGCAGGRDSCLFLPVRYEKFPSSAIPYEVRVHGLQGGHSGINIGEQRGNANVLLARLLSGLRQRTDLCLASLAGGSAHNAIPREAVACFTAPAAAGTLLEEFVRQWRLTLRQEYVNEPGLAVALVRGVKAPDHVYSAAATDKLLDLLAAAPDGVMAMSREVKGLVETSVNFATIGEKDGEICLLFSQRSSKEESLRWLTRGIESLARLAGCRIMTSQGYPGWQPDMQSDLLARARKVFQEHFGKEAGIEIIHAGLECGIIGAKYQGMDMISIGPTIRNPHSPDERLHIPSLAKIAEFTGALLASYCAV